jgi:hypothetical protein
VEFHIDLDTRWRVVDAHGDKAPSRSAAFDGEAGQGAVRDHDAAAGEQDADLDHAQVLLDPRLDLIFFGEQAAPGRTVAVGTVRPHLLDHLADQLVAQLLFVAGALDPEFYGGGDVAATPSCARRRPLGRWHARPHLSTSAGAPM